MVVDTVKLSTKGQLVIPQDLRISLGIHEGDIFAVAGSEDTIILRKISLPSKTALLGELETLAKQSKVLLKQKGITEKDLHSR